MRKRSPVRVLGLKIIREFLWPPNLKITNCLKLRIIIRHYRIDCYALTIPISLNEQMALNTESAFTEGYIYLKSLPLFHTKEATRTKTHM